MKTVKASIMTPLSRISRDKGGRKRGVKSAIMYADFAGNVPTKAYNLLQQHGETEMSETSKNHRGGVKTFSYLLAGLMAVVAAVAARAANDKTMNWCGWRLSDTSLADADRDLTTFRNWFATGNPHGNSDGYWWNTQAQPSAKSTTWVNPHTLGKQILVQWNQGGCGYVNSVITNVCEIRLGIAQEYNSVLRVDEGGCISNVNIQVGSLVASLTGKNARLHINGGDVFVGNSNYGSNGLMGLNIGCANNVGDGGVFMTGGRLVINTGLFRIGWNSSGSGGNGYFALTNGTVESAVTVNVGRTDSDTSKEARIIQAGGTFKAQAGITLNNKGSYVMDGGTLETSSMTFTARSGQTFTWGSGTIKATAANVFNMATKARTVSVTGTPAVFDTGDFAQNLPSDIASATGSGTLKLTGGNNVTLPASSTPAFGILLDGDTTLTVDGSGTRIPSLTLMAGSTLNITNHNGNTPLTVTTLTFPESGKVNLSMEGEAFPSGVYAIYSADGVTVEDGEKFAVKDTLDFSWSVEDDTLLLSVRGVASATWTGAANDGVYSNPANWICYDASGNEVPDAVPGPAAAITLGTDVSDGWSSFDAAAQVGAIDLNGHNLAVSCSGTLAFSVTNSSDLARSELRITVPQDATFNKTADFGIAGNLSLVKDGPGMLLWSHAGASALAASIPVFVTNGVFKTDAISIDLFGTSGTVTVKDPGQFDINITYQYGQTRARTFYIEGDGPDGSGAIVNSAANTQWGYHLNKIVLTGDATIGGRGFIDIRDSGNGIDCGGYELTVKNTGRLLVEDGTHLTNATDVVVSGGNLQVCNSCVLGAERIVLEHGGKFTNYQDVTRKTYNVPFVVREGSGIIQNAKGYYEIHTSITVESNCTLNFPTDGSQYICDITNKPCATINIGGNFWTFNNIFKNDGTVNHTAGQLSFGYPSATTATSACAVENNGTIRTVGGDFRLKAESSMTGTGTLELAGGSPQVLGTISDFTGTIVLSNGTATITHADTFTGTLRLKGGALNSGTSLASFPGTAVFDVSDYEDDVALDTEGKNILSFSSGKEVFVDLGERKPAYGTRIVSWPEGEGPASGVKFRLVAGQRGYISKDSQGLIYTGAKGLTIIVK